MSLLKLITNTATGLIQAPIAASKCAAGAVIGILDDGEIMDQGARDIASALKKIGSTEDHK